MHVIIAGCHVTRHDGRHKDAALKVTESDSAPDTQNHHKVIQGRSAALSSVTIESFYYLATPCIKAPIRMSDTDHDA